jgi:NTE family protein
MKWRGKRIGLVLGGGGVRGFSHIGVLKVLEQEDLFPDVIVGSSAGALIGGAYASGASPREVETRVDAYLNSPEFKSSALRSIGLTMSPYDRNVWEKIQKLITPRYYAFLGLFKPAVVSVEDFQSLVNYFIPDMDIRDTRIPFHAVATDLITGEKIVISDGSLKQAVLASCAVPGAVEPVRLGEWLLADGGITSLAPVQVARQKGADVVIAVVVDRHIEMQGPFETAQDIFFRAGEITADKLGEIELREADVVIRPNVGNLHWMDFKRGKDLIKEGEIAARKALDEIYGALPQYKRVLRFIGRLKSRKDKIIESKQ